MMTNSPRRLGALVAVAVGALALSACSAGSLGSNSGSSGGKVTLSFLADNTETSQAQAKGLAQAFTAKNPDITVNVESRPGGSDGDNLIKTRLSTGDMTDVFMYNTGSLFQAIAPEKNLVPLDDQPWAGQIDDNFKKTVTAGGKVYGAPSGTFSAGAVMYNRPIYTKLNLQIPKTWADFMANNAKIKAAGIDPIIQTYQQTWTSQLFVLGDFHNVLVNEPDFPDKYTKNQAKYATDPYAIKGFEHQQQAHDAGYFNKDFASATLEDGLKKLANGNGAHYPILSGTVATIVANYPDKVKDVGMFPLPGDDAAKNGMTVWTPGGLYIPKTVEGAKLDAAKKFVAFIASPDGCASQSKASAPTGPYAVKGCELPADVPQVAKDIQTYIDKPGGSSLALEFLSPIKGPALEQITVEVGSGIRKADAGAKLYDQDVKKQAQQLGLPGW
jgi:raffinose/stachyose/melibiose transport system substrate-binding protein